MTADVRSSGTADARNAWHAFRAVQGDALENITQEQLYYEAFSAGARWSFRTSAMLAPYLDSFVRLLEFLSERRDDDQ